MKSDAELREIAAGLEAAVYLKRYGGRIRFFEPYAKQREFLRLGATKRERLLLAGNRLGKSETGAFEAACHLTGKYPPWWEGRVFKEPTKGWIAGVSAVDVRDVCQTKLCGQYGVESEFGAGMIAKEDFIDKSLSRGVTDAYDTIQVKHVTGGVSVAKFKTYEQGRQKFQGEGLDWIWFDEEPPLDIYGEGMTRVGERDGMGWLTFTPLEGRSAVVLRFLDEPSPDRSVTSITIDEATFIPAETRARMVERYLPHEREARARGVPMLGSGRIFTTAEETLTEPPIEYIPAYWKKLWGIDFGIGHPFGAVLILWDVDNDVIHIHQTVRIADALVMVQAAAMKRIAAGVPVAWPRDGTDRDANSGEPLSQSYKRQGLRMMAHHATWEDGSLSTEAGIAEWDDRERTGRLKVARQLQEWLEERRYYHRKDGRIVKIKDDLMSATRIALMAKRGARAVALGSQWSRSREPELATGVDFDLF